MSIAVGFFIYLFTIKLKSPLIMPHHFNGNKKHIRLAGLKLNTAECVFGQEHL